jgi:branched-chain amino acid transport system ATP-binding protein
MIPRKFKNLRNVFSRVFPIERTVESIGWNIIWWGTANAGYRRGMMSKPSLILLDEPSMGLSPILVEEIFNIIKEINSQGTSILLVEQNALMALSISNRAYVLETGRIVLEGDARDIKNNPQVKSAYLGI